MRRGAPVVGLGQRTLTSSPPPAHAVSAKKARLILPGALGPGPRATAYRYLAGSWQRALSVAEPPKRDWGLLARYSSPTGGGRNVRSYGSFHLIHPGSHLLGM